MAAKGAPTSRAAAPAALGSAHADLASTQIGQIQRGRLLGALVHVAEERGVANLIVADVVTRAGVSRRTFYELFSDCEDCLLAALEDAVARASARVLPVYQAERGSWCARIRAGLVALLRFFDEQPHVARLLVVEWLAAGPGALVRRQQLLARFASAVEEGLGTRSSAKAAVPELMAEGVVGAVFSLLHARLLSRQADLRLTDFTNPLMAVIVLPYLGRAAACRELGQPVPEVAREENGDGAPEDLLRSLKMRLTYRTMRVLAAVVANPGGSNRVIARASGIDDQGQISKLLMRLRKLGLLENHGAPGKGEPNAWTLSPQGAQIERMIAVHNMDGEGASVDTDAAR